jgi:hypothetical protein
VETILFFQGLLKTTSPSSSNCTSVEDSQNVSMTLGITDKRSILRNKKHKDKMIISSTLPKYLYAIQIQRLTSIRCNFHIIYLCNVQKNFFSANTICLKIECQ